MSDQPQQVVLQPVVAVHELGVPRVALPDGQNVPVLSITLSLQIPLPDDVAKAMGADLLSGTVQIAGVDQIPKGPLQ